MYVENAKPKKEYCTTEKEFYESIPNAQTRKEYRNEINKLGSLNSFLLNKNLSSAREGKKWETSAVSTSALAHSSSRRVLFPCKA